MARQTIRLNRRGIAVIAEGANMRALVEKAAEEIAGNVRAQGIKVGDRDGGSREVDLPVNVKVGTTDRSHATVTLAHPAGVAVQAKHGVLTKAASQAGLQVH